MQITTLMQAPITLASIKYKYNADNRNQFYIKITTSSAHGIYGKVKVQLANVKAFNVGSLANYFNTRLLDFIRTGDATLECVIEWQETSFTLQTDLNQNSNFQTLPNNGSAITAEVKNKIITIQPKLQTKISFDDRSNYVGTNATFATFTTKQYNKIDENNEIITTNYIRCDSLQNNLTTDFTGTKIEFEATDITENTKLILAIK